MRPLAIVLFAGLHGWEEGLVAAGWDCIGFDIEDMCGKFSMPRPHGVHLVLQDVLTLHGKQFRDVGLICASPPCQAYSYRAMPWKRAKALPPPSNALFDACFRIQFEAMAASGKHVPMIVENVCGAQKWVGRARAHYGSYYLWGDVPALMPRPSKAVKVGGLDWNGFKRGDPDYKGQAFNTITITRAIREGYKQSGSGAQWFDQGASAHGSKSTKRALAAALIAKIPFELAHYIGRTFIPPNPPPT